jgi:hypothetical protein
MPSRQARSLVGRLIGGKLSSEAIPLWKDLFAKPVGPGVLDVLASQATGRIQGSVDVPQSLAAAGSPSAEQLPALLFK